MVGAKRVTGVAQMPSPEPKKKPATKKPALLSGGNPQIPKGDGDGPVQAYIAAAPGWKGDAARQLDELIVKAVPGVRKAVRWNSPFYGAPGGEGWFLGFHAMSKYIKVNFPRGASLEPQPPITSSNDDTRYFHIAEGDELDVKQLTSWFQQAAKLPGWGKS